MGHYQSPWDTLSPRLLLDARTVAASYSWVSFLTILFPAVSLPLGAVPRSNATLSIPLSWQLLAEAWSIFFPRFQLKNLGDQVATTCYTQLLTKPQKTLFPHPTSRTCFRTSAPEWLLPRKYNIAEAKTRVLWGNCSSLANWTLEKEVNRTEFSLLHAHEFTASTN